ncbi:lymphotactin-like [Pogoniulus pusillus]|uniref:lymphotactin-like n=1 Tax=Pogoniulus pusillus TaxID=488313 RepID=UPI0030B9A237
MTIYKLCKRGLTTATFFTALTKEPPAMKLHIAALLVIFWLGMFTMHTVQGSIASQSMRKYSCESLTAKRLHIKNLVSYENIRGPIEAIMFITRGGVRICVKPDHKQAQQAMKEIAQRQATKDR